MNLGRSVFAQLISFLPDREFRRCVSRYDGDRVATRLLLKYNIRAVRALGSAWMFSRPPWAGRAVSPWLWQRPRLMTSISTHHA